MTLNHIIKGAFLQHSADRTMEPVILATKAHKDTQRREEEGKKTGQKKNQTNKKLTKSFCGVQGSAV